MVTIIKKNNMKPLELTDDQKNKLLEMCNTLFPEYEKIYWNSGKGSNGSSEYIGFGTKKENNFVDYIYIHWFEFCMIILAKKIIYPLYVPPYCNSEEGLQIGIEEFGNDVLYYPKTHPVDYLYKKFLKLINENS